MSLAGCSHLAACGPSEDTHRGRHVMSSSTIAMVCVYMVHVKLQDLDKRRRQWEKDQQYTAVSVRKSAPSSDSGHQVGSTAP